MGQEVIIPSLVQRLADRWNWVLALTIGGMFGILRLLDAHHPASAIEWLLPFVAAYLHLTLTPVPWQWAGRASQSAQVKGLLLAVVFNALWITASFLAFRAVMAEKQPPPPPPGWAFGPPPGPRPHSLDPGWALGLVNLAVALFVGWILAEKEAMQAREQKTAALLKQAEAKALQNQLEPHVLYNALSSLSELVYEDPLAAESVITQLADLYRMLTRHGKRDLVNLGEERRLVEAYLAMEQMRLGERLRVTWNWPNGADAIPIPPLFLQPLVENAIKHGIGPCDTGGEVRIACLTAEGRARLMVENTGAALSGTRDDGIGLSNLQARLKLWAGADATFSLVHEGGWSIATLTWKMGGDA